MKHFINIVLAFALLFMVMGCGSLPLSHTDLSAPLVDQAIATEEGHVVIAKTSGDVLYHGPREIEVTPVPEVIEVVEPAPITTTKINEIIFFPYDSSEITADEMVKINKIVELLTKYTDTKIVIGAYASVEGSFDYNLKLSCKRGDAVTDTLIAKGVNADRITTLAYGGTDTFSKILKENRRAIVVNAE